jgi:hypothetical protein
MTTNVIGLGEVCEALACAVGQIAPNPCYTLFVLIFCAEGIFKLNKYGTK